MTFWHVHFVKKNLTLFAAGSVLVYRTKTIHICKPLSVNWIFSSGRLKIKSSTILIPIMQRLRVTWTAEIVHPSGNWWLVQVLTHNKKQEKDEKSSLYLQRKWWKKKKFNINCVMLLLTYTDWIVHCFQTKKNIQIFNYLVIEEE